MKRLADDSITPEETRVNKRVKTKCEYAVMIVYLSGDDDYGALNARDYGEDRIVNDIIDGVEHNGSVDFNIGVKIFVYKTKEDCKTAVSMIHGVLNHVGDYDHMKHNDVICHEFTD